MERKLIYGWRLGVVLAGGWQMISGDNPSFLEEGRGTGPVTRVGVALENPGTRPDQLEPPRENAGGVPLQLHAAYVSGVWTGFRRLELGALFVPAIAQEWRVGVGPVLFGQGSSVPELGFGAGAEARIVWRGWVSLGASANWRLAGRNSLVPAPIVLVDLAFTGWVLDTSTR